MSFAKALAYFLREAAIGLLRSWKVSWLAVLTIGVSLYVGGLLLLVSANLEEMIDEWKDKARVIVYLTATATAEETAALRAELASAPSVATVAEIDSATASERFSQAFPSMADLLAGLGPTALPPSFEITLRRDAAGEAALAWIADLRSRRGVAMVDDDRDWLHQVETVLQMVRGVGLVLSAVLLGAAIFTIASVVRLTSYLYRHEIAVMRLVGATELYIRGPFYVEGILQGLLGGLLAGAMLDLSYLALRPSLPSALLVGVLARRFLSPTELGLLVGLGVAAGLFGAVVSLGRETFASES